MKPKRIQLKRKRGWRMPPNTVVVTRPGPWGNHYRVKDYLARFGGDVERATRACVGSYRDWLLYSSEGRALLLRGRELLRGKNLACWCRKGQCCHGDVWLELVNRRDPGVSK